jgi:hypothetical protein
MASAAMDKRARQYVSIGNHQPQHVLLLHQCFLILQLTSSIAKDQL